MPVNVDFTKERKPKRNPTVFGDISLGLWVKLVKKKNWQVVCQVVYLLTVTLIISSKGFHCACLSEAVKRSVLVLAEVGV